MRGFTLIELLVCIVIIAILIAIIIPSLAKARYIARGETCKNNLRQLSAAINMYVSQYKDLPDAYSLESPDIGLSTKLENFLDAPKPVIDQRVNPWCCSFDERYYKLIGGSYQYPAYSFRQTYTVPLVMIYEHIPKLPLLTDIYPRPNGKFHMSRLDGSALETDFRENAVDMSWLFNYRRN